MAPILQGLRLMAAKAAVIPCLAMSLMANDCPSPADTITMMPAKFEIGGDTRVGKKSSGLICAPSGSWYWRDVTVDRDAIDSALKTALEAEGMNIADRSDDFGEPVRLARLRMRVRILAYRLDACIPWKPTRDLVGGNAMRGSGQIETVWELYSADEQAVIKRENVTVEFSKLRSDGHSSLLAAVLKLSASSLAKRWHARCQYQRSDALN